MCLHAARCQKSLSDGKSAICNVQIIQHRLPRRAAPREREIVIARWLALRVSRATSHRRTSLITTVNYRSFFVGPLRNVEIRRSRTLLSSRVVTTSAHIRELSTIMRVSPLEMENWEDWCFFFFFFLSGKNGILARGMRDLRYTREARVPR